MPDEALPEFIDIHSHVNFEAFSLDRDAVISRAREQKTWMINVGTQKETSTFALEIAKKSGDGVYAIVGLHPIHTSASYHDKEELGVEGKAFTSRGETFDYNFYKKLASDPKVVAIGECGLDYFRADPATAQIQKEAFIAQIALAKELGKPLMLHIRNAPQKDISAPQSTDAPKSASAYKDAYDILKEYPEVKGNVHFFAGTTDEAKMFLSLGFTLSFTGVITFTHDYDEVIKNTPLDMIMSETDCPYITPVPYRGKRNEPAYVQEVVKRIAEIKGESLETVKKALVSNTFRVFKL
ncbi:TatD family deoxyribonuclease [Candidatus Parcubacteria bacterium]|nr:TatD family deoxyribonuclease [Candidatus Parcubacteria bacterium]